MNLEITRFEKVFEVDGKLGPIKAHVEVVAVSVAEAEAIADIFWKENYHQSGFTWTATGTDDYVVVRRILPDAK